MLTRILIVLVLVTTLTCVVSGCTQRSRCCCAYGVPAPVELETGPREGNIKVDTSLLAQGEREPLLIERLPIVGYRKLTAPECQCLAATNAPLSGVLEIEAQLACCDDGGLRKESDHAKGFRSTLARIRSIEVRNRASGEALETFYQLVEAEGKRDLLKLSVDEVESAIEEHKKLRDSGINVPIPRGSYQRQRTDLFVRRTKLIQTIDNLNGKLRFLLHLDERDTTPILPVTELTPRFEQIDVDLEIADGLASRPDLAALRLMRRGLNSDTMPIVQNAMQGVDPSFAALGPTTAIRLKLLARKQFAGEIGCRRGQLEQIYDERQRLAIEEIRQAAHAVEAAIQTVSLHTKKAASLREWREDLKELRKTGEVSPFEITNASLEILKAEGDLLQATSRWKISLAQLKEAKGELAAECNFTLPSNCR